MILIIGVTRCWVVTGIVRQLIIRNSKFLILFNVFTEVGQPHITLAQERVVEGQRGAHMLWLMTARSNLQIVAQQRTVVRMGAVFDDFVGAMERTLASEVGHSLLCYDDIYIMFGTVHMTTHRHDGADGAALSHRWSREDGYIAVALVVA